MSLAQSARGWLKPKHKHTDKEPPASVRRSYAPVPASVSAARRFAAATAARWQLDPAGVELVTGELANNAVRHGRATFSVTLVRRRRGVRIEVTDPNPDMPRIYDAPLFALGGRGLLMVEQAAAAWGCMKTGAGKTVWAEVDAAST